MARTTALEAGSDAGMAPAAQGTQTWNTTPSGAVRRWWRSAARSRSRASQRPDFSDLRAALRKADCVKTDMARRLSSSTSAVWFVTCERGRVPQLSCTCAALCRSPGGKPTRILGHARKLGKMHQLWIHFHSFTTFFQVFRRPQPERPTRTPHPNTPPEPPTRTPHPNTPPERPTRTPHPNTPPERPTRTHFATQRSQHWWRLPSTCSMRPDGGWGGGSDTGSRGTRFDPMGHGVTDIRTALARRECAWHPRFKSHGPYTTGNGSPDLEHAHRPVRSPLPNSPTHCRSPGKTGETGKTGGNGVEWGNVASLAGTKKKMMGKRKWGENILNFPSFSATHLPHFSQQKC